MCGLHTSLMPRHMVMRWQTFEGRHNATLAVRVSDADLCLFVVQQGRTPQLCKQLAWWWLFPVRLSQFSVAVQFDVELSLHCHDAIAQVLDVKTPGCLHMRAQRCALSDKCLNLQCLC